MRLQDIQTSGIRNLQDLADILKRFSNKLVQMLNTGLRFDDNLDAQEVDHTFTTVDTEEAITIALGRTPIGWMLKTIDAGAVIYASGTAHTSTTLYLKATATCSVTLYVY